MVLPSTELTLSKVIGIDFDSVPDYLSQTNPCLEKKISCILPSTITLEQARDIAILMHKIICIEIVQSLWITYQKSGTGNLSSKQSDHQYPTKFWPYAVRSHVTQSYMQNPNDISEDHEACLTLVNHCLQQLTRKNDQYRHELNVQTSRLTDYTRSLEFIMEKFVEQGVRSLRTATDHQIKLVQYFYTDQLLENAYLAQNPNEYQVSSFSIHFFSNVKLETINETL